MENNSENKMHLFSNIKHLRISNGETQEELGSICGKTNTAISNWEKGIREPDAIDLSILSNHFGISIDDLMKKDLRFEKAEDKNSNNYFDELAILFDKHKDILTESDKTVIKTIIEERKKEIDRELDK